MTTHYGATPDEWAFWSSLDLRDALLPTVCRPGLPHTLRLSDAYGKIPSRFTSSRRVMGFERWTTHYASSDDLTQWASEPDYGICLIMRHTACLDIDIDDRDIAQAVQDVAEACVGVRFPTRGRSNSGKRLLLFRLASPYGKRVIERPAHERIEILGVLQQAVVAGMHPSGVRYDWGETLTAELPTLTTEQVDTLSEILHLEFGDTTPMQITPARAPREAHPTIAAPPDPLAEHLVLAGLMLSETREKLFLRCPWYAEHGKQGDQTQTVYLKSGTGGYDVGQFKCQDSACEGRSRQAFLLAVGYVELPTRDGFADESTLEARVLDAFGVEVGEQLPATPLDLLPAYVPGTMNQTGSYWPIPENLVGALLCEDLLGWSFSYDRFRDEIMVQEGARPVRPYHPDLDPTRIIKRLRFAHIDPKFSHYPTLERCIADAAHQREFDSVEQWLRGLVWDGVPRIGSFYTTYLKVPASARATADSLYLWSAFAARALRPGYKCDLAPIWISREGSRKTSAIRALVPDPAKQCCEIHFGDKENENSLKLRGKLVVELSELRGLGGKDGESVKAFMTRLEDEYRAPYAKSFGVHPRRFIMIGTTNDDEPLPEGAGRRRWLPQQVGCRGEFLDINRLMADRDQLWAEACVIFDTRGVQWGDAEALAEGEMDNFVQRDDIFEEEIQALIDGEGCAKFCKPFRMIELARAMGIDPAKMSKAEQYRISRALKAMGFVKISTHVSGVRGKYWSKKSWSW